MLFQCLPTVFDAGPTSKHHWVFRGNVEVLTDSIITCGCLSRCCYRLQRAAGESTSAWPSLNFSRNCCNHVNSSGTLYAPQPSKWDTRHPRADDNTWRHTCEMCTPAGCRSPGVNSTIITTIKPTGLSATHRPRAVDPRLRDHSQIHSYG